jgi:hypothetical protein
MSKLTELHAVINKKNGQINTYLEKKKLPKNIIDAIKKQPGALKSILIKIKGVKFK